MNEGCMRIIALSVLLLLTGCGSLSPTQLMRNNMLDTAPKEELDIIPKGELAVAPKGDDVSERDMSSSTPDPVTMSIQGPVGQSRTTSYAILERFLLDNGIDYEVMTGNHIMVRLKDTIKFDSGSAAVTQDSAYWLSVMGSFLSQEQGIDVVIDGHTDSTGRPTQNDSLSIRRAQRVKDALIKKKVPDKAIYTRGYGENIPACTNLTNDGRACNRRVELLFIVSND